MGNHSFISVAQGCATCFFYSSASFGFLLHFLTVFAPSAGFPLSSGKGISGFPDGTARSCGGAVWTTISTSAGSILAQNLAAPESFTLYALETKTTDTTERRIKKNVGFTEAETVETQTPSNQESASVKKKAKTMKARTKTAVWITAAILCPAVFSGSAWTWAAGIFIGRTVIRLLLTAVSATVLHILLHACIIGTMLYLRFIQTSH